MIKRICKRLGSVRVRRSALARPIISIISITYAGTHFEVVDDLAQLHVSGDAQGQITPDKHRAEVVNVPDVDLDPQQGGVQGVVHLRSVVVGGLHVGGSDGLVAVGPRPALRGW